MFCLDCPLHYNKEFNFDQHPYSRIYNRDIIYEYNDNTCFRLCHYEVFYNFKNGRMLNIPGEGALWVPPLHNIVKICFLMKDMIQLFITHHCIDNFETSIVHLCDNVKECHTI